MKIKKYIKMISLSLCLTIATTGMAFADTSTDSVLTTLDEPVSNTPIEVEVKVDEKIYNKQVEIDNVLFKDGSSVLESKGINITHTVIVDDYIELGIEPFNEENANMIYELVGKDLVKVVEGTMAITLEGSLAADVTADVTPEAKSEINTTVATEAQVVSIAEDSIKEKNSIHPLIIGVTIIALLGGILVFMKKIKTA
ncbi:MAG: hypothetical protein K0Q97_1116 [Bacillota bacterium]|jgi:hypothetical protein|nr:hypothetical protein [Bacillota bacterium]